MKITTAAAAAIAVAIAAAPLAAAAAAEAPIARAPSTTDVPATWYEASYDAARDRYCIRVQPEARWTVDPRIVGRTCRSAAHWRKWGLSVSRVPRRAAVAVADATAG